MREGAAGFPRPQRPGCWVGRFRGSPCGSHGEAVCCLSVCGNARGIPLDFPVGDKSGWNAPTVPAPVAPRLSLIHI